MSVHIEDRKSVTVLTLQEMRDRAEKIAMLTCYDSCFARVLDDAGVDMLLIGDSLGMVLQGHRSTLPVTLADMTYHTRAVASARTKAMVVADMPFASYQSSPAQAFESAAALMSAGAQMVKMEGGAWLVPTVEFVRARGIPVCAHLGLTPQSVHALGGYRVQGRGAAADTLVNEALALEQAGADVVLVELIPTPLGARLTESLCVPTIGIGAGPHTSGQVLVLHDMLDLTPGKKARFVKNYLQQGGSIQAAVRAYVEEVKSGAYPQPQHGFAD